ncbi:MAG TPA: EAL domain-containing protein [Dokdonella sp.]
MPSIVVVEDRTVAREYLAEVLGQAGYRVFQAPDALAALNIVRAERPQLVITDILMQAMSGAEFADRLHDEPALADTQLMFYTASYRLAEARVLAKSCRVTKILAKPAAPNEILAAVADVLGATAIATSGSPAVDTPLSLLGGLLPDYLSDLTGLQRRLRQTLDQAVTDAESRRAAATDSDATAYAFHSLSLRLAALLELDIALASERDPQQLVSLFCLAAHDILNSRYAGIGIVDGGGACLRVMATRGLADEAASALADADMTDGVLGAVLSQGKAHRSSQPLATSTLGLPPSHPPITSLLAVPIPHPSVAAPFGWVYFADKVGAARFDDEDAQFAVTLAAQLAVMYGNLMLFEDARKAEADLAHRLTHDQTTGLPRFALVEKHLDAAFADAAAPNGRVVLLYVDIDRFHVVNETRGRAMGDEVLRVVAGRLGANCDDNGYVAHVAGDEFAVVLVLNHGTTDAMEWGDSFRRAIEVPIVIGDQRVYLTCSVGISSFPQNGSSPQVLLRQAEAALRRARLDGRNTVRAFSNEQQQALDDRRLLGLRLSDAIRAGELVMHYQPQVDAKDGRITGFECLVRWQSPEFGFLLPGRFLDVAEDSGLIVELGEAVLDAACRQVRVWLDQGKSELSVSVNVSGLELQRPEFIDTVRAALARYAIPAQHIELELTEGMILGNVERGIQMMQALKSLGVTLALDDFGTGYSSLNYLRRFPIDKLKIDRSFVHDICTDRGAAGVCRAIIALGHELGMVVLAEGVETAQQAGRLRRDGCDQFQGFLFSKGVAAADATGLLNEIFLYDSLSLIAS